MLARRRLTQFSARAAGATRAGASDAQVPHEIEIYSKAKHGFAVTGHIVFDREASELTGDDCWSS